MNKSYRTFIVIATVLLLFVPSTILNDIAQSSSIENMPFKQEIAIPVDSTVARYQPIDIHISFNHPCWAKNESWHSVRVCYNDGSGLTEIESQIYGLHFTDDSHIDSCNIVFILPGDTNGREKYYVVYSDSETRAPNYPNHVDVEDCHYFYEPISGQKMDFDYYKITQDDYVVYGICQKGVLLGEGVSHTIIKLKPNSTEFESKNADQFASFAMSYAIDGEKQYTGSPRAETVSKNIVVDGNLMVRVKIESISPEGNIKTSNIYTYYYCPTSTKRIVAHVNHQVLDSIEIGGDGERDGTYASLSTFKSRSATINDMNVGNILPSLHIYCEDDTIKEYSVPTNPESHKSEWILSTSDDIDLGGKAWLCIDDSSTGKAHALIFQSNTGLLEGEEEGIQVKASVKQVVKLPGLEADTGSLFATRNAYEKGKEHNLILPKGMNVTFDAEFVTVEGGGYEEVDKESENFQKLTTYRPLVASNLSKVEEKKRYGLTAYVHLAPSFPLGSLLSAASGKNFSYLYAELYREALVSSGSIGRLSLSSDMSLNLKNATLIQKVKAVIGLFDWRNASLFKKIHFPELEEGRYLVKIYRENPLFGRDREYIGFGIVDLKEDSSVHIFCRPEGKILFSAVDQNSRAVEQVRFLLLKDETVVAEGITDKNGTVILKAPCLPMHPYKLHVIYQGFLIEEKDIRLSFLRHLFPLKEFLTLPLYRLRLRIKDSWRFAPAIDVNPILTSKDMIEQNSITAEQKNDGEYFFSNLYPADYTLRLGYKSFIVTKNISIKKDEVFEVTFPAEFSVNFNTFNSYGMRLKNEKIRVSREGKEKEMDIGSEGTAKLLLPPGRYEVKIIENSIEIAKQDIDVKGSRDVNIVTTQGSIIHAVITYLGAILSLSAIVFTLWKKKVYYGGEALAIAFIIIAIVSPWWVLTGEKADVKTATNVFLYPPKMVTLFSTSSLSSGDISSVPSAFTAILSILSLMLIISVLLSFIDLLTKKRWKKLSFALSIVSIILLIIVAVLFLYAMSQVTSVGVGSFSGRGDLDIIPPGTQESITISCRWGGGIGLYLTILAITFLILVNVIKILTKKKSQ
ncbi:MAG: hypothetical protein J7K13_01105 [Thermoplasmata archaeon]|nr:hypothetical protein [Thermoplasmata archaeon]